MITYQDFTAEIAKNAEKLKISAGSAISAVKSF